MLETFIKYVVVVIALSILFSIKTERLYKTKKISLLRLLLIAAVVTFVRFIVVIACLIFLKFM